MEWYFIKAEHAAGLRLIMITTGQQTRKKETKVQVDEFSYPLNRNTAQSWEG